MNKLFRFYSMFSKWYKWYSVGIPTSVGKGGPSLIHHFFLLSGLIHHFLQVKSSLVPINLENLDQPGFFN